MSTLLFFQYRMRHLQLAQQECIVLLLMFMSAQQHFCSNVLVYTVKRHLASQVLNNTKKEKQSFDWFQSCHCYKSDFYKVRKKSENFVSGQGINRKPCFMHIHVQTSSCVMQINLSFTSVTKHKIHHLHSHITTYDDFNSANPSSVQEDCHIRTQLK